MLKIKKVKYDNVAEVEIKVGYKTNEKGDFLDLRVLKSHLEKEIKEIPSLVFFDKDKLGKIKEIKENTQGISLNGINLGEINLDLYEIRVNYTLKTVENINL